VSEPYKVPSREEHNKLIYGIWKNCVIAAIFCFVMMGGIVAVMSYLKYDSKSIINVMLITVYIVLPAYAIGYVAPTLATSLIKMSLGVEMSREGLEIGKATSDALVEFKNETKPLVADLKAVVGEVKPMVGKIGTTVDEVRKIVDDTMREFKEGNGKLEGRVVHTLRKAIAEAREAVKDAEGEFEKIIWNKVDKFLATVFEERQDEAVPHGSPEGAPVGDGQEREV
jgi:hypothetical protein